MTRAEAVRPIVLAITLTLTAEISYFVMWGVVLFPNGSFMAKAAWTFVCGIAMGSVIGAGTIALVVGKHKGWSAVALSATIVFTIGTTCSYLCSEIDTTYNYFGGQENRALFLWAGILPTLFGGPLYGWLLFGDRGQRILTSAGL